MAKVYATSCTASAPPSVNTSLSTKTVRNSGAFLRVHLIHAAMSSYKADNGRVFLPFLINSPKGLLPITPCTSFTFLPDACSAAATILSIAAAD